MPTTDSSAPSGEEAESRTPRNQSSVSSDTPLLFQHPSTAQHVDDLFKKWTRAITKKLKNKKSKQKVQKDSEDGRPALNLNQVIEIQRSVVASSRDEDVQEAKEEVAGTGKKQKQELTKREEKFETLDHEPPLSHEAFMRSVFNSSRP
jgi:hypothetical protein